MRALRGIQVLLDQGMKIARGMQQEDEILNEFARFIAVGATGGSLRARRSIDRQGRRLRQASRIDQLALASRNERIRDPDRLEQSGHPSQRKNCFSAGIRESQ